MSVTHVFAGIPVSDFGAARRWYERLLGRPPDRLPHDQEAVWQLADTGLIYVVADPERAGSSLLTVIVDDLDGWLAGLARRGIAAVELDPVGAGVRRARITDPDGNLITLGQLPAGAD